MHSDEETEDKCLDLQALRKDSSIGHQASNQSWMISFGDLLTLLLCFFLSIVSFSPLNGKAKIDKNQVKTATYSTSEKLKADSALENKDGTSLALNKTEGSTAEETVKPLEVRFMENELTSEGDLFHPGAIQKLKKLVSAETYQNSRLEIECCSRKFEEAASINWQHSSDLAVAFRRQIVDAFPGLRPSQIALRPLGKSCNDSEGFIRDSEAVVALVRIETKIHG